MLWTPPSWENPPALILASQSPRRKALLQQIGVDIICLPVDICEQPHPSESAAALIQRLAQEKASAGARRVMESIKQTGLSPEWVSQWQSLPILGADTLVVDGDDVLPKPQDRAESEAYLRRLSGRTHKVITGVSIIDAATLSASEAPLWQYLGETQVSFRPLREEWIRRYWDTGEPQDKAGGYAIQGLGSIFIDTIQGSYTNVVGLPVEAVGNWLALAGVKLWHKTNANHSDG